MFFPREAAPNYGSVLWMLIHVLLPGTVQENLNQVWKDIDRLYGEMGTKNKYHALRNYLYTSRKGMHTIAFRLYLYAACVAAPREGNGVVSECVVLGDSALHVHHWLAAEDERQGS